MCMSKLSPVGLEIMSLAKVTLAREVKRTPTSAQSFEMISDFVFLTVRRLKEWQKYVIIPVV